MAVKNVHGHILDTLGEAIVSGHYGPSGAVPPEAMLCEELGVSRTVVREAIKSLVAKGLVTTGPKVGTRVTPPAQWNWFDPDVVAWQTTAGLTREFLRDVQELRRIIEPAAVRLAAERATAAEISGVEAAFAGMKDAVENGGDYVRHDLAFHLGLLRACHNRMLVQMSDALGALLRTAVAISTRRPHGPANSLGLHRAVLDAVIAREPQKAERASLALIDSAHDDIEAVLASRRKLPSVVKSPHLAPSRPARLPAAPQRQTAAPAARSKTIKT